MSEQENIKVVEEAYQNFKSGNIEALLNLMSEDVMWQLPEIENVAFSGQRKGRTEVAEFFATLGEAQEVRQFEPQQFVAQDDKVVALGHYVWHARATAREYEGDFAHVFTIRESKITGFQEYTDTAAVSRAHQKALSA